MCCDPRFSSKELEIEQQKAEENNRHCPDCGELVDEDGDALDNCHYSPQECKTCDWRPCDQSC